MNCKGIIMKLKGAIFDMDGTLVNSLVTRTFSLVEDNTRDATLEIPFLSMDKVEIVRETPTLHFGKKTFNAHYARLIIQYEDGKVLNIPIHDDITADQLAQRLTKMIETAKKTAAAAAQA